LLAVLVPSASADERRHSRDEALFSAAEYLDHVSYLASDELEGRGTGQEGIDQAANYIADYFRACGVKPGGDNGTYFQEFTIQSFRSQIGADTRLAIGAKGRKHRRPAKVRQDYVPFPFSARGAFKGEVVFAGYGIVNEEEGYDDYAGVDASGKVVLVLRRAPKFARFSYEEMAFRTKATRANARDAAALLVVNPVGDDEGDTLYEFETEPNGFFGFGRRTYGLPMMHVTQAMANKMLSAGGLPELAAIQKQIEDGRKPVSAPLKGVSVRGLVDIDPVKTAVRNVIGLIPGTGDQASEYIVLGGHYDHVGVRNKGEPSFDPSRDISNGADDNASGTAMVMTLANAYTKGAPPNRSIVLVLFTAEEMGLIGSRHYAENPTVHLDECAAMLNFDMVGRLKNDLVEVGGMRTGGFEDLVQRDAEQYGLKIKDGGGGSGPSDHMMFYAKKIPVLFFFTGLHRQYHQPTDDANLINSDGAMRIAKLAADCIDEIDASAQRPQFASDERGTWLTIQEDDTEPGAAPTSAPTAEPPPRGVLGVYLEECGGEGVVVTQVVENSPAQRAGIKKNDRILKIGDEQIDSRAKLVELLGRPGRSERMTIVVRRGAEELTIKVRLGRPHGNRR
jgi:hypothetical protein